MSHRPVVWMLLAGGCVFVASLDRSVAAQGQRSRFSVSVDTVSVAVTVLDDRDRIVAGLPQENFKIYENGVEQQIEFFSREELRLKMVILLDTSTSMREKLPLAQEAAVHFVRTLKPGDEVQVVEFNERVLTLVEFTSDFDQVAEAIMQTELAGATSLYNAIYISLKDLEALSQSELDRRAIIVLSDGNDTNSRLVFEDVRQQARKSNVMIYAISLRASEADLKKDKYRNAKYELDMLARESGGVSYAPEKIGDLSEVYDAIAAELKGQYTLSYISTNPEQDGSWRQLQILSAKEGSHIRAREGYYAPKARRTRRTPRSPLTR